MGFSKKNIEKTQRNGKSPESKVIVKYITQMGNNGAPGLDAYNAYITPQVHVFSAGPIYAYDNQMDRINVLAFRGGVQLDTFVDPSEITGTVTGIDCSVHNNGTNQTYIDINVSSLLSVDGSLNIPITYNVDVYDSSSAYDASTWDASTYSFATTNAVYSWTLAKSGESLYYLDLSNENASINADASGNILSGAVRPTCTATLNFGSNPASGVQYSISYPSNYGVQGVSINSSTGVLTFNAGSASTPFRFGDANDPNDTVLEITVDASLGGTTRGRKVMTVTKVLPGQSGVPGDPGEDAVSRWIELSANQVRVDASNNCIPNKITATAWKQVGEQSPATDASTTIKWAYDTSVTGSTYSSPITVDASKNYMTFKLYYQNTYLGESETVPILRDGKDGQPGPQGRKGAAVRGPIEWDSSSSVSVSGLSARRFCSGEQTDPTHPEDAEWIDIILHDSSLYMCTTSYTQPANASWSTYSSNWQVADQEFEFIATKLLLAKNAKINFLSGNELYLMDASDNITAGAAGGNGVSFWAGGATPGSAPFQVDYQGNIKATSGTFAGYVQFPYTFVSDLTFNSTTNVYSADERAYLVSDSGNTGHDGGLYEAAWLKLPNPTSSWNGFTYKIIVEPIMTRSEGSQYVHIYTANSSNIYVYAFPQLRVDTAITLEAGEFMITCMPKRGQTTTYVWAITQATGAIYLETSGAYIANAIGSSYDSQYPIYEIVSYGTTRPSVLNTNNTIFVSRS